MKSIWNKIKFIISENIFSLPGLLLIWISIYIIIKSIINIDNNNNISDNEILSNNPLFGYSKLWDDTLTILPHLFDSKTYEALSVLEISVLMIIFFNLFNLYVLCQLFPLIIVKLYFNDTFELKTLYKLLPTNIADLIKRYIDLTIESNKKTSWLYFSYIFIGLIINISALTIFGEWVYNDLDLIAAIHAFDHKV